MKKKWHIKKRMLVTLVGLTCAILLAVGLAFNLSMYIFIRQRVNTQLSDISENASKERREGHPPNGSQDESPSDPPDDKKGVKDHPDRIMGTRGNAIIIDKDGNLIPDKYGDNTIAEELTAWYNENSGSSIKNKIATTSSGTFAVTVTSDPLHDGQVLLSYVDITSLAALIKQINFFLVLIILFAIIVSVLLSRRFAKTFSAPVKELSEFAQEIGRGNLEPKELSFRDVEFDDLAASMNKMAVDLHDAKQKQDIFFQNVSHELRTPLTSIRGNAEGIAYDIIEPKQAAKVILAESDKLGGMVEDILYLSRTGKAKNPEDAEPIDLREVISLCVSEQRAEAEKRSLAFTFDFSDEPVMYRIREQDAERLFGNIISNAVRYAKSEILLVCKNTDNGAFVSIKDDGDGIDDNDMPHIFERMYKGRGGKHGIGLSIVKSIADSFGGTISVRNDGGAVFEIILPI